MASKTSKNACPPEVHSPVKIRQIRRRIFGQQPNYTNQRVWFANDYEINSNSYLRCLYHVVTTYELKNDRYKQVQSSMG